MTAEIECAGAVTKQATLTFTVSYDACDGLVHFGISARYKNRKGDAVQSCLHEAGLTPKEASRIAGGLFDLANGDEFALDGAGLTFYAGEDCGIEIELPHGWACVQEDADVFELAEEIANAAMEAGA